MTKKELKATQDKLKMLQNGKAATEQMSNEDCFRIYGISKAQVLKNLSSAITGTEQDIHRAEHPLMGINKKLAQIAVTHITAVAERDDLETHHNGRDDFFEIPVWELKAALKSAYRAGCRKGGYDDGIHNMYDQLKALTNMFFYLSTSGVWSEDKVMETLLEVFDPLELEEMGYGERIKPFMDENY